MTNLDIIKYLATNNPSRLAQCFNDIHWDGCLRHHVSALGRNPSNEFDDFEKWLNNDAKKSSVWYKDELKEWSKAIKNPSIEITYPDNLVIELPYEGKDPNHMWNTDNNFNIINQAIDEVKLLENIFEADKYSDSVYNSFRKEVCAGCRNADCCLQSKMAIVECPKFENYYEI